MTRRRGFALVAALWFVALLSGVALDVSLAGQELRVSTINAQDESLARASAEAGVEHARAVLHAAVSRAITRSGSLTHNADPWRDLARFMADTIDMDEQRYAVQLRDVGATLNVNTASEEELRRLFVALRIDAGQADRLAQAIADWRDVDDLHRARGAEVDAYLKASAPVLPANALFRDERELRWILGMSTEVYGRIVPVLTTVGSGRVNLRTAGRPVLLSLPGMTEEAVEVVVRLRREPWRPLDPGSIHGLLSASGRAAMLSHLPALVARTVSTTMEVEVQSVGWAKHGRIRALASALVIRAGDDMITAARRFR
jgi:general secretion pathway protein K